VEGSEKAYSSDNAKLASAVHLQFGGSLIAGTGHWYALHVRSRHEKAVESSLKGKGYPAFSPFYRTRRKRVERTAEVDVALFPGYVFCHFDSNYRLPILMTPGIVGVVGPGKKPGPVDDTEIALHPGYCDVRTPCSAVAFLEIRSADQAAFRSANGC